MSQALDATINLVAGTVRGWRGTAAFSPAKWRPEKLLRLYDFEACPYCRLVREALTELDLDVLVLPCAVGGGRSERRYPTQPPSGRQALDETADLLRRASSAILSTRPASPRAPRGDTRRGSPAPSPPHGRC